MSDFALDPKLAADSFHVKPLGLSDVRLMNDQRFPWLLLIPRVAEATEILDLDSDGRQRLVQEIAEVSAALKALTHCDKLNIAALGNQVKQLHVHVIARFVQDAAWPNPVWGAGQPQPYAAPARADFIADICAALGG